MKALGCSIHCYLHSLTVQASHEPVTERSFTRTLNSQCLVVLCKRLITATTRPLNDMSLRRPAVRRFLIARSYSATPAYVLPLGLCLPRRKAVLISNIYIEKDESVSGSDSAISFHNAHGTCDILVIQNYTFLLPNMISTFGYHDLLSQPNVPTVKESLNTRQGTVLNVHNKWKETI